MRRREYLPLVAATALPLAGCSETDSTDDPSGDGSDTAGNNETSSDNDGETESQATFEIQSVDAPETVRQPDPIPVSVTVANTGDADGTYTGELRFASDGDGTLSLLITRDIEVAVPAGETVTLERDVDLKGWGYITLYIGDHEQEITLEPEDQAPQINRVSLIDAWEEFGDVEENAIETANIGEWVAIGIRYRYWHAEGTHAITTEATIHDSDGQQVEVLQDSAERLTDDRGWGEWEWTLPFNTESLEAGEYEAEVYVRDDQTDEVSDPETTTFEIE